MILNIYSLPGKVFFLCLVLFLSDQAQAASLTEALKEKIVSQWGKSALSNINEVDTVLRELVPYERSDNAIDLLRQVNVLLNQVPYYSDFEHWQQEDYWASPAEMLSSYGADCEDYVIAKYFALIRLGVPVKSLRLTYVRALQRSEGHMVLAFYASSGSDPLILDNLINEVKPGSKRKDLEPVYSFNGQYLWTILSSEPVGSADRVSRWRELIARMNESYHYLLDKESLLR